MDAMGISMKTICVAGKNDIAVDVLAYCLEKYKVENNIRIVATLTRNDKGVNCWQRSLKWYCENHNVEMITLEEAYDIEDLLFLSVEYDRIIKTSKFKSDKLFNIHFSLLPEYKGMYTSVLPILHGKKETGVTLHSIRDGIDTGEIIFQKKFEIGDNDSSLDVYRNLIKNGTEVVISYVDCLLKGEFESKPQDKENSTYFSPATIDYANLALDARRTANQIKNQIRAFAFRPYQLLKFEDVDLIDCEITDEVSVGKPGQVIENTETYFRISTIDYDAILYKDVMVALFNAIKSFDNDKAKLLCVSKKILNDKDEHGWTALTIAVYNNNFEMTKWLIEQGADLKVLNNNGTNLLMYAKNCFVNSGDAEIFEFLLKKGLSPLVKDYVGKNLIDYCNEEGIDKIGCWTASGKER